MKKLDTLGGRIAHTLEARQMSQVGLEQEARLARGYVTRILKGDRTRLSPEVMRRIADALRVNYEWLATGGKEMDDYQPAVATPEPPVSSSALETAIAYDNKWTPATVAAARALAATDEKA